MEGSMLAIDSLVQVCALFKQLWCLKATRLSIKIVFFCCVYDMPVVVLCVCNVHITFIRNVSRNTLCYVSSPIVVIRCRSRCRRTSWYRIAQMLLMMIDTRRPYCGVCDDASSWGSYFRSLMEWLALRRLPLSSLWPQAGALDGPFIRLSKHQRWMGDEVQVSVCLWRCVVCVAVNPLPKNGQRASTPWAEPWGRVRRPLVGRRCIGR